VSEATTSSTSAVCPQCIYVCVTRFTEHADLFLNTALTNDSLKWRSDVFPVMYEVETGFLYII